MTDLVGRRLGDFDVVRELGRGGMGVVYAARQLSLNRRVALKVLAPGLGLTPRAVDRFRREAEAAARLHHTNIVPVYATGEQDGVHFYAMELIDGPSLDHVVRQLRGRPEGKPAELPPELGRTAPYVGAAPLTPTAGSTGLDPGAAYFDTVARMVADVADALYHAHQSGVLHRDIKPSNLLLSPDGRLSVNDFGLARVLEQPGVTMTGEFVGTPAYTSPEQVAGGRIPVDHRTDVYSLGATLYELLTLRPPFVADRRDQLLAMVVQKDPVPPRRVNPKVPVDLETVCLKAMEKDPDRRYQSARDLADDLRRYVNRFAIRARRAGPVTKLRKWAKRNPALTAALAGLLLLALAVGFFAYQARRAEQERLAERRQQAIDQALVAALGGDFVAADKATREAEVLGAHPGWVRMLQGLVELHRGDPRRAMEQLRQAVDLMPDSVAARAMLLWARANTGEWLDLLEDELAALERLRPVTAEDYLFLGSLQAAKHPAAAVRTLDEAIARRKSGVALLTRAWARSRLASDTGTPVDAEEAVDDARAAQAMLGDTPYVLVMSLAVHDEAAAAYRRTGRADRRAEHVARGEELAARLEPYRDRDVALIARGYFFWEKGDDGAALAEWRRASERGSGLATKLHVWGLYRRGEFRQALRVCEAAAGEGRASPVEVERLYVFAELDPAAARTAYREVARRPRPDKVPLHPTLWYACAARLLGDNSAADDLIRPLRDSIHRLPGLEPWCDALIAYNCGERTDEQLLAAAGASRWARCEGHHHVALRRLAAGSRAAAREHFRQSVATHVFAQYELAWSRAFLDRMENDDTWPPWVR
jgi:tetratricopeptide (TPR) repeat protein